MANKNRTFHKYLILSIQWQYFVHIYCHAMDYQYFFTTGNGIISVFKYNQIGEAIPENVESIQTIPKQIKIDDR